MATQLHRPIASMEHDEIDIVDQVMATHDPNGDKIVNATDVLNLAENILSTDKDSGNVEKGKLNLEESIQKDLARQIAQLSIEVVFKSVSDADCHSVAIYILSMLSPYPWEAKTVIMLAAFALICGKFISVSQHCNKKRLANKLALMKPNLFATPSCRQSRVFTQNAPVRVAATGYLVNQKKLADDPIITSVVDLAKCVVEINQSTSSSLPQSQNNEMEESTIIDKIQSILSTCHPLLEAKRMDKSYEALLDAFSNSSNNSEVLKLIFNIKDDNNKDKFLGVTRYRTRHYHQTTRHRTTSTFGVDFLKNERMLLIVIPEGANVSEVEFLDRQLANMVLNAYTIWVPIVDNSELWIAQNMQLLLLALKHRGWLVLDAEKRVTPQFVRFVRERCSPAFQTDGEPIIISLDRRGRLVHTNALHMIWTWRDDLARDTMTVRSGDRIVSLLEKELAEMTLGVDSAIGDIAKRISDLVSDVGQKINDWRRDINAKITYLDSSNNCTSKMENELWDKETWSLKLLVHLEDFSVFRTITNWIEEKNDIFLYGGDDTKCIQEFVTKVKEVKSKAQANIKLAYIGKSKKVSEEALDSYENWCFWTRLRSAFISRINYLNEVGHDEREDKIVRGLKKLLAYGAKGTTVGCWALLGKENEVLVCDLGDKMLRVINMYEKWKDNVDSKGFSQAFKDYYDRFDPSSKYCHPCCAVEYPTTLDANKIPEDVQCPQCSRNMHKFVTFTCCHNCNIFD